VPTGPCAVAIATAPDALDEAGELAIELELLPHPAINRATPIMAAAGANRLRAGIVISADPGSGPILPVAAGS
jgi:hypothetical protein